MQQYWFTSWLRENRVLDEPSLRRSLQDRRTLLSLLEASPPPQFSVRTEHPPRIELTGGKGIDLTGELGCRHVNCLSKELDLLFRHTWHYFDVIRLPDQALSGIVGFQDHGDVVRLADELLPALQTLRLIQDVGGEELVHFEVRVPSCPKHLEDHARDAEIEHALANTASLVEEIASSATITWSDHETDGHRHVEYQLDHPAFLHSEWGALCEEVEAIPARASRKRERIATQVLERYLAGLSADALAARRSRTTLGAAIPLYRRLLATHPAKEIEDIAFELSLPVSPDISIKSLIELRRTEDATFQRFQRALAAAIRERLNTAGANNEGDIAQEIRRDIIDPEVFRIRDTLAASRKFAARSAAAGVGLGVIAATIGLLSPLNTTPIGPGLAVGGALTVGAAALKNANDGLLSAEREVSLSDMYFLWKAHQH